MLLCDNYNGGYHLFCLKPELTQVPVDNWYCSSCSPTTPWFLFRPCHAFPGSGLGGGYMRISFQPPLCVVYICVHTYLFSWLVSTFNWFLFVCLAEFPTNSHPYDTVCHDITRHDSCHARIHGLIHDGRLRACPSYLLGLMYVLKWLYAIRCLGFQLFGDCIKGPSPSFLL
jgi:hypothetical protein